MSEDAAHIKIPDSLAPSQEQLANLQRAIFARETVREPFDDIPKGVNPGDFVELTAPVTYDETIAPATTLRAPDGRVIWLSIFRNPDNNGVISENILIVDPPINRDKRAEIPEESYMLKPILGQFAILNADLQEPDTIKVLELQQLIEQSEPFNPFQM